MNDSDEYGEFDDSAFLQAATLAEKENTPAFQTSRRATKRRKLDHPNERTTVISPSHGSRNRRRGSTVFCSSDEESSVTGLPVTTASTSRRTSSRTVPKETGSKDQGRVLPWKNPISKAKQNRIHTPSAAQNLDDIFNTQPPREHSPPWKTRGAIWQKQTTTTTTIGVHRPDSQTGTSTGLDAMKTMAIPGRQSIASRPLSLRSNDYDPAQDLAGLPSDAFASSSSSPQKQGNEVEIVSERRTRVVAPQTGLRQTTLFGREGAGGQIPPSQVNKRYNFIVDQKEEPPTHHKLDLEALKTWVYPDNLGQTRDYQFNIVAKGLFHNLLVALPTGLGKTFIAATVMLNFFRWTTEAQIVFVAPTKPLVTQQAEACYNIVGIPRSHTTVLIGGVKRALRAEEWSSKRVFFMTPETLLVDLQHGYADPKKVVLLVVDEAHRATGSYAYVQVVSMMRRFNSSFRILALTATPGADVESVQKVINGLDISKIEIRTETSMDICQYVHQRKIDKHVFDYSDEMLLCMELYSKALKPLVNKIKGLNVLYSSDPLDLTPYGCTQARLKWMSSGAGRANSGAKWLVQSALSTLASISMGMELLKYHGIRPFYNKIKQFQEEQSDSKSKQKKEICESDAFKKLLGTLSIWSANKDFIGHPKLDFLQDVILEHFTNAAEGEHVDGAPPAQTRIMVFAHWRDSAEEIVRVLKRHEPIIRPHVFVGQATSKNSDGMSQKEQTGVIEKFQSGTHNTLVATSIGEEGLDIGEVDMIVCYDSKASPIRMLQRMGRTGRKRDGRIVLLQMSGKEQKDFLQAKDNYEAMQKIIADGNKFTFHNDISRRIVPREIQPVVDKRMVDIPVENSQQNFMPQPKGRRGLKAPAKKFHMPDGVITGFVTAGRIDQEIAPKPRGKKKAIIYPSEEPVDLPDLESVLLNESDMRELAQQYQQVYDENDEDALFLADLNIAAHAARQRVPFRTSYFRKPGRAAQEFVGMMGRIHSMDQARIAQLKSNVHSSDIDSDPGYDIVVPDGPLAKEAPKVSEDMWEDDDPASQPLAELKIKPGPKPKAKPATATKPTAPRGRPHTTPAVKRPRGRPRKHASPADTPARQPHSTPQQKTPIYQAPGLAFEAASSSPPPTDPRMRVASQADTIGSDDTLDNFEPQDTQAYKLDSDLCSFIADDDEVVEMPESSLPMTSFDGAGLGRGTQAVVRKAMEGARGRKGIAEKIFSSDVTDNEAVVSSDVEVDEEEEEVVEVVLGKGKGRRAALLDEEDEDEEIVVPRPRKRRVVIDDEDE
ncbi:P-loop containing nucleoside triphosphate hydrolase protein [Polyplosphaeria fusca]|uniref:ATP-dependent DNA helicase n=1 Tax=Polyplosphaeria fusca TaxID=682080 RepID=A0A9P4R484_9PLEO|nr:P-loop containing nucleoside triphosphate hydrolase protein [Polyplosphaeria fusca]